MGRPKKSTPVLHEPEEDFSQDVPDEEPARVINEDDAPESNGKISKAQAVRNAQAQGHDKPGDIADFARKHYGLEISNQQVSAYKSQNKTRGKSDAGEEPTAPITQPDDDQSSHSKTDLIREALEAGFEKPAAGVDHIKKKYGVDIDAKYYSIIKGKLGKSAEKPESEPVAAAPQKSAAPAAPNGSTGVLPGSLFDDLKQLRQMKDRYGDDFGKMVEAIG